MVVLDPNITDHVIQIVPRITTPIGFIVSCHLHNESTGVTTTANGIINASGDKQLLTFTHTFLENDRYSIKVVDALNADNVRYRGNMIATTQVPQDYKIDNDNWTFSTQ